VLLDLGILRPGSALCAVVRLCNRPLLSESTIDMCCAQPAEVARHSKLNLAVSRHSCFLFFFSPANCSG
jgi:hypothetical protein